MKICGKRSTHSPKESEEVQKSHGVLEIRHRHKRRLQTRLRIVLKQRDVVGEVAQVHPEQNLEHSERPVAPLAMPFQRVYSFSSFFFPLLILLYLLLSLALSLLLSSSRVYLISCFHWFCL